MVNIFKKWFFGASDDEHVSDIIKKYAKTKKKKPIEQAIINSMKNDSDDWEFQKRTYSQGKYIENYTIVNKLKHIKFICSGLSSIPTVDFLEPINVELERDDCSELSEYVNNIWDNGFENKKSFLYEHVNHDTGFNYYSIDKEIINLFELRFWCFNNCTGKYFIDGNMIPEVPGYIKEREKKNQWINRCQESGEYNYFKCWFEHDSDMVTMKLVWGGK